MDWKDINIKDFKELQRIEKECSEEDKPLAMVSYLYDVRAEELPITIYMNKLKELAFLNTEIQPNKVCKSYTINGNKYNFNFSIEKMTTAQFYDFMAFQQQENNEIDLLSIVLIPDGHSYSDGYNMTDVKEDLGKLSMVDYMSIIGFFLRTLKRFFKIFQRYLMGAMKKMKMNKEERENVQKLFNQLMEYYPF